MHTKHTNCATYVSGVTTCTCAGAAGGVIGCAAGNGVDGNVTVEDVLALATANTQTHNCQGGASKRHGKRASAKQAGRVLANIPATLGLVPPPLTPPQNPKSTEELTSQ